MKKMKPNVAFACVICERPVEKYVVPSRLKVLPPKVCSRKCQGKVLAGSNHPMWKGGRSVKDGHYMHVYMPGHPHATKAGYVREHRLVMERTIGRYLRPEEVVHHENENTLDNRPENLRLFPNQAAHKAHEDRERRRASNGRLLCK